jgi:hypothetical protein
VSDKDKPNWLSSPTTVIAIATVLLNIMGFLTVSTFNIRMGLPVSFFEDTPISYLQWGAKALVVLIMTTIGLTLVLSIAGLVVSLILRITILRFQSIKELLGRCKQHFNNMILGIHVTKLTATLFITALMISLIFILTQNTIIQGFMFTPDYQPEFNAPKVFSSSNKAELNNYVIFSAILIIILGLLFLLCNRIQKSAINKKIITKLHTGAIFSLWLVAISFWVMPYRLMTHNEFEEIQYKHRLAYVISEKDSRLFLYVPGQRPFVIEKSDSLLSRTGEHYFKNIFDN